MASNGTVPWEETSQRLQGVWERDLDSKTPLSPRQAPSYADAGSYQLKNPDTALKILWDA